ncbi:MAG: four helix bundle protein [Verrucomicrobiae bacterium]|nr:four helix bundle protein [Verrucomicrobiae bacterium]
MALATFEDLQVWQRGCRQAVDVCRPVENWRIFSLRDQLQRAAISVPSNIAEGHERDSSGDFVRFLRIAKGSNGEMRTQLYIAQDLGLISSDDRKRLATESKEIAAMLQGLITSVQSRSKGSEN